MIVSGPLASTMGVDEAAARLGVTPAWVRKKLADPTDPLPGLPPRSPRNPGRGWLVDAQAVEALAAARAVLARPGPVRARSAVPPAVPPTDEASPAPALADQLSGAQATLLAQAQQLAALQAARADAAEREVQRLRDELAAALDAIDALTARRRSRLLSEELAARDPS